MPKLRLKNIYAKDETGKGYKIYEELEIEYQDNGDDEKLAKIVNSHIEGNADRLDTYDALAEDMIISPEGARSHKFFGKNAAGTNYWEGGLTTVAERGAELIQIPGKPAFLAESEMLLNLPKGTRILNNSQTKNTLRDKVANLKDRVSNLKGGNSYGGNNYSIVINVNGGNPSEVERIVRKVIAGDINKRERTAFG